jgi:hypothetical protein
MGCTPIILVARTQCFLLFLVVGMVFRPFQFGGTRGGGHMEAVRESVHAVLSGGCYTRTIMSESGIIHTIVSRERPAGQAHHATLRPVLQSVKARARFDTCCLWIDRIHPTISGFDMTAANGRRSPKWTVRSSGRPHGARSHVHGFVPTSSVREQFDHFANVSPQTRCPSTSDCPAQCATSDVTRLVCPHPIR